MEYGLFLAHVGSSATKSFAGGDLGKNHCFRQAFAGELAQVLERHVWGGPIRTLEMVS